MNLLSKYSGRLSAAIATAALLAACNKELPNAVPNATPAAAPAYKALGDTLGTAAKANDSLYYRLVVKAGMLATVNNKQTTLTMFVPTNAAMKVFINAISGGMVPLAAPDAVFSGFITDNMPAASAAAIVSYHTVPQAIAFTALPGSFPNLQYPSILNPAPSVSALLRLTTFPSSLNGNFVNNVPVVSASSNAANGLMYEVAAVAAPPQRALWERINTDAELTIFKAAIMRADSGTVTPPPSATPSNFQSVLNSIGTNLTVYAPVNAAVKATISALTGGAIPVAAPDATFIGFLASNNINTQTVKGLVSYHILFGSRAFNNNLPTTSTFYKTMLSVAVPAHPGVRLKSTFSGPVVSAASVEGVGNGGNPSNVLINPTPDATASYGATPPATPVAYVGQSDQHYTNGVLHKIDRMLLPQ